MLPSPASANQEDRPKSRRMILDISVGAALALALLIVLLIDTLSGPGSSESPLTETLVEEEEGPSEPAAPLRLAVTPPEFDDMGGLLDSLGHGYQYETAAFREFLESEGLKHHDVVFLTCGGVPTDWLSDRLRDSDRGSAGVYRAKPQTVRSLYDNLRDFVRDGGTLYVSDLHFDVLVIAFPEFIDDHAVGRGAVQTVDAQVVDEGLRKQLGDEISLRFDMRAWRPAAFRQSKVTTYLEGEYELVDGAVRTGPLLVSFSYGKGTVIFTSFHNEAQNSDLEKLLLRYLVFASVTAGEQEDVRQVLVKGGFSPRQRNLLALTTEDQPVTEVYENEKAGPLQFVLGFANRGAQLKLTVTSPKGKQHEKSGRETFSIGIDRAEAGKWEYTITPTKVPYRNFPFTLTIGEK
jgi:hypothetical protein